MRWKNHLSSPTGRFAGPATPARNFHGAKDNTTTRARLLREPQRGHACRAWLPTAPRVSHAGMTTKPHSNNGAKLLLRATHVDLDDGAKAMIETKAGRLFRHEPRIDRVRIEVERDIRGRNRGFVAKGRVELAGPDLTASVSAETAPAAVGLLIDKLDRMLRKRTSNLLRSRTAGDIRAHAELASSA